MDSSYLGEARYPIRTGGRAARGECEVPGDQEFVEAFGAEPSVETPGGPKVITVDYPDTGQQLRVSFDSSERTVRCVLLQGGGSVYDSRRPGLTSIRIAGRRGNHLVIESEVDGAAAKMILQVFPYFAVEDVTFVG